jgi:hypothetical protein
VFSWFICDDMVCMPVRCSCQWGAVGSSLCLVLRCYVLLPVAGAQCQNSLLLGLLRHPGFLWYGCRCKCIVVWRGFFSAVKCYSSLVCAGVSEYDPCPGEVKKMRRLLCLYRLVCRFMRVTQTIILNPSNMQWYMGCLCKSLFPLFEPFLLC